MLMGQKDLSVHFFYLWDKNYIVAAALRGRRKQIQKNDLVRRLIFPIWDF